MRRHSTPIRNALLPYCCEFAPIRLHRCRSEMVYCTFRPRLLSCARVADGRPGAFVLLWNSLSIRYFSTCESSIFIGDTRAECILFCMEIRMENVAWAVQQEILWLYGNIEEILLLLEHFSHEMCFSWVLLLRKPFYLHTQKSDLPYCRTSYSRRTSYSPTLPADFRPNRFRRCPPPICTSAPAYRQPDPAVRQPHLPSIRPRIRR